MRSTQDWNKYVDMLGKAVSKQPAVSGVHDFQESGKGDSPAVAPAHSSVAAPPRKGRGPRKEETKEELLRRLLDPTLTLEETARILDVCPTTVRRYTNRGILPHERSAGNQRRFKLSDVVEFRQAQQRNKEGERG